MFYIRLKKKKMSELLIPSFVSEWIAQVAHQKWVIVSESLRSLTKNERSWANRSFLGKKRAIYSENRWANSQPWFESTCQNPWDFFYC